MITAHNIKNIAIGIGVMILLPLLTHIGAGLIVNEPSYPKVSFQTVNSPDYVVLKKQYALDRKKFNTYYFYITIGIGIAAIIVGVSTQVPFLGMGFILGGLGCLLAGYVKNWNGLNDWFKFLSLLLVFLLLVMSSFKVAKSYKD